MAGPVPPHSPQAPQSSGGGRRAGRGTGPEDADVSVRLAPREELLLDSSVVSVGRRGRGPLVAAVLVVAAFALGLARPWDLLAPPSPAVPVLPPIASSGTALGVVSTATAAPADGAVRTPPPEPTRADTCGYPSQWRSSTIEDWVGRPARVWRAARVVEATGPDDPSIPVEPVVAATVTAIGWCAPVDGPDRPPRALVASLYRITPGGVARPVAYDRLEPREPDALGELWVPTPRTVGDRPPWPLGRYVIQLRSESGRYVRYLGLELTDRVIREVPQPLPSSLPEPSPSGP